jgi:hypothetical protein
VEREAQHRLVRLALAQDDRQLETIQWISLGRNLRANVIVCFWFCHISGNDSNYLVQFWFRGYSVLDNIVLPIVSAVLFVHSFSWYLVHQST